MINDIELSPSEKARCKRCGRIIPKGTPRGRSSKYHNNHYEDSYYCYKCTELEINEDIEFSKELKKQLKKMIKQQNKEIILGEL